MKVCQKCLKRFTKFVNFCKIIVVMKKSAKLISAIIIIALIIVSCCFIYFSFFKKQNSTDTVEDLVITNNSIVLKVGDKVNLKELYNVKPLNISANVFCCVANTKYATINENQILTAKCVGNTTILLKVDSGDDFIEKDISLRICESAMIPSSINFETESVELNLEDKNIVNRVEILGGINYAVEIKYSEKGICSYNYETGLITPLKQGETVVTIIAKTFTEEISKSFKVCVISNLDCCIKITTNGVDLDKIDDGYEITLSKFSPVKLFVEYLEEGNDVIDFTFDYVLENNTCNLYVQKDNGFIMLIGKESGNCNLKIQVKSLEILIKVKVN